MIISIWKYSKNNGIGNSIEINGLILVVVAKAMARCGIRLHTNMVYQWLCVVIDCNISWLKLDISTDRGFYKWYDMYRFMLLTVM